MIFYTNAPERYDYGFTIELDPDVGNFTMGMDQDKPVRKIDIRGSDFNIENQVNRNRSGLYPTITEKVMETWIKFEYFIPRAGWDEISEASPDADTPPPSEEG